MGVNSQQPLNGDENLIKGLPTYSNIWTVCTLTVVCTVPKRSSKNLISWLQSTKKMRFVLFFVAAVFSNLYTKLVLNGKLFLKWKSDEQKAGKGQV